MPSRLGPRHCGQSSAAGVASWEKREGGGERQEISLGSHLGGEPAPRERQRGCSEGFEVLLKPPSGIAGIEIARCDALRSGNLGHEDINELPARWVPRVFPSIPKAPG